MPAAGGAIVASALTRTRFVIASAQRRGDFAAVAAFLAPTRLSRSARNDSSRKLRTREASAILTTRTILVYQFATACAPQS